MSAECVSCHAPAPHVVRQSSQGLQLAFCWNCGVSYSAVMAHPRRHKQTIEQIVKESEEVGSSSHTGGRGLSNAVGHTPVPRSGPPPLPMHLRPVPSVNTLTDTEPSLARVIGRIGAPDQQRPSFRVDTGVQTAPIDAHIALDPTIRAVVGDFGWRLLHEHRRVGYKRLPHLAAGLVEPSRERSSSVGTAQREAELSRLRDNFAWMKNGVRQDAQRERLKQQLEQHAHATLLKRGSKASPTVGSGNTRTALGATSLLRDLEEAFAEAVESPSFEPRTGEASRDPGTASQDVNPPDAGLLDSILGTAPPTQLTPERMDARHPDADSTSATPCLPEPPPFRGSEKGADLTSLLSLTPAEETPALRRNREQPRLVPYVILTKGGGTILQHAAVCGETELQRRMEDLTSHVVTLPIEYVAERLRDVVAHCNALLTIHADNCQRAVRRAEVALHDAHEREERLKGDVRLLREQLRLQVEQEDSRVEMECRRTLDSFCKQRDLQEAHASEFRKQWEKLKRTLAIDA